MVHTSRRERAGTHLRASSHSGGTHDIVRRGVNPWAGLSGARHSHPIVSSHRATSVELTHLLMLMLLLLLHTMVAHLAHGGHGGMHGIHRSHAVHLMCGIHLIHLMHGVHLSH